MKRAARLLRWVAGCAAATFLLWLAFRSVEWGAVGDAVRAAGKVSLVLAVALNLSILLLWTVQWKLFAGPVGRRGGDGPRSAAPSLGRVFEVVTVMSTVSNSVPFMAGQATGVHLLATRGDTGHVGALSVLALDQLAEGLAKVALLALLAFLAPLPPGLKEAALTVTAGVSVLAAGLVLVTWLRARDRLVVRPTGARGGSPSDRIRRFVLRFADGLHALRSPRTLVAGIGLALAMKVAEGGAIVAVQHALGVEVPFWATVLVLASVGLATMVAVAPGNLGVYEASAFAAYRLAGLDVETSAALALLQHALFLLPAAGTGWLVLAAGGRGPRTSPVGAGEPGALEPGAT